MSEYFKYYQIISNIKRTFRILLKHFKYYKNISNISKTFEIPQAATMADRTTCRWSWPGAPSPSSPVMTASALSSVGDATRSSTVVTSLTSQTVWSSSWRMDTTETWHPSQWIHTDLIIINRSESLPEHTKFMYLPATYYSKRTLFNSAQSQGPTHLNFMWHCALRHIGIKISISAPCGQIWACEDTFW